MTIISQSVIDKLRTKARRIDFNDALDLAGITYKVQNGQHFTDNTEAEIEAFIDSFDHLAVERKYKIEELKEEGLARLNAIYGDDVFLNVGEVKLLIDIDATYTRSGAPAPRLVSCNQVLTAFENAKTAINAIIDADQIAAYDVVNAPAWP